MTIWDSDNGNTSVYNDNLAIVGSLYVSPLLCVLSAECSHCGSVYCLECNLTLENVNSELLLNGTSCVGCVGSCVRGVFPTGLDSRAYI